MSYPRRVQARLFDYDRYTEIEDALDAAFDITFLDEVSAEGIGSLSLLLTDPNVDELRRGRYVQIDIEGNARFCFKIEGNPQYRQVDVGEESAHIVTVRGRSAGNAIADEAIIYPEFSLTLELDDSWRRFNFASPSFPNDGSWPGSTEQYEYHDGVAQGWRYQTIADAEDVESNYPSPVGFPWPNSPKNGNGIMPTPTYIPTYWIWPSAADDGDEGFAFFRDTFTLEAAQPVTFSATADNLFTLYFEGVPILGEDADHWMWQGYKEVTMWLPAGTYQIGAVVENVETDLAFNPGGFIYAAYVAADNDDGALVPYVPAHWTNTLFKSHFSTDEFPGWTPAQILLQAKTEAEDRGVWDNHAVTTSFLAFEDTDGNDWDSLDTETSSEYIPEFNIEIGKTYLDMLKQLHEEGWIDWHWKPGELELDVYAANQIGFGTTGPTYTTANGNLVGLERDETAPYANSLLVQWAKGYVKVTDSDEVTAYGTVVEDLFRTDSETRADAQRKGRIELQRRVADARAAVLVTVEPTSATDCPYEAFQIGDYIAVPQEDGTGTEYLQVLAITVRTDALGYAIWQLELNRRFRNPLRDQVELLRSIGGKSVGSAGDRGVVR